MRPLQSRVDPFGQLHAVSARGLLMGNRGGRFHKPDQSLGKRRWASRQWIACVCQFKGRQREVWKTGYTELFFLDEVTALAAGHRPCFECRRADALAFQARFGTGGMRAAEMDHVLHAERLAISRPLVHAPKDMPEGTVFASGKGILAKRGAELLPWSFAGYSPPVEFGSGPLELLTPPAIVAVLARGYQPLWHRTAGQPFPGGAGFPAR